jgi:hypothetical protein
VSRRNWAHFILHFAALSFVLHTLSRDNALTTLQQKAELLSTATFLIASVLSQSSIAFVKSWHPLSLSLIASVLSQSSIALYRDRDPSDSQSPWQ